MSLEMETRTCACGCGAIFKVSKESQNRYASRLHMPTADARNHVAYKRVHSAKVIPASGLVTITQLARAAGLSVATIGYHRKQGNITAIWIDGLRGVRYDLLPSLAALKERSWAEWQKSKSKKPQEEE